MRNIMLVMLLIVAGQVSCGNKESEVKKTTPEPFSGTVVSVANGGGYSYVEIKGESGKFWSATRPIEVKKGDKAQLVNPMKMEKFQVKSLDRTFDVIYFADDVLVNGKGHMEVQSKSKGIGGMTANPDGREAGQAMKNPHQMGKGHMGGNADIDASGIKSEAGSVAIEDLLKNPENYAGETVKIHGLITKFLPMIMEKNWLHLKDASCGAAHLVATTDETFKVGDTVMLSGKVEVNKDFGFGYKYNVLLTHAEAGK